MFINIKGNIYKEAQPEIEAEMVVNSGSEVSPFSKRYIVWQLWSLIRSGTESFGRNTIAKSVVEERMRCMSGGNGYD